MPSFVIPDKCDGCKALDKTAWPFELDHFSGFRVEHIEPDHAFAVAAKPVNVLGMGLLVTGMYLMGK